MVASNFCIIFVLTVIFTFCSSHQQSESSVDCVNATVYYDENSHYRITMGVIDSYGAAYGCYKAAQNTTGWGELNIIAGYTTNHSYTDEGIAKAAGFLEGALTYNEMYSLYRNLYSKFFEHLDSDDLDKVKRFFSDQREWMNSMIQKNSSTYWKYIGLINQQFEGLKLGYKTFAPKDRMLEDWSFDYLAANGDYLDMLNFVLDRKFNISDMSKEELMEALYKNGHCSVLIKVLPGYENLFASHSSWYIYEAMVRIYKHYDFKLRDSNAATRVMSFSSFAGVLSSWDDFYIMDSKLMMLQTTNSIYDHSIYKHSQPQSLLSWHRVRLANWLASTGKEWSEYVSEYNSGTYNNQYMILDLKKINLTNSIEDGALWVVEQIPGYVEYADQTAILREGYWASYNIPFYETIYNASGYPTVVKRVGPVATHELYPRAKIFRRDQGNVKDMDTMKYIMRYNNYKTDPYSEGNPMNAICSRGDLALPPSTSGCIDTKISDYHMALEMTSFAESGPTYQDLPPFQWSHSPVSKASHLGEPDLFKFNFITMKPTNLNPTQ